jgi:flagella basal body P-ring formation protein FlgA
MQPLADLVVARFAASATFQNVELDQVKQTLHDAGANLAFLRFCGSTTCTVSRSDATFDEGQALRQWVAPPSAPSTQPIAALVAQAPPPAPAARTLRDLLIADLCERLSLAPDAVQIRFGAQDEGTLRLVEPLVSFTIDSRQARSLGDVRWDVTIQAQTARQRASILAFARAWQTQVVAARPIAPRQIVREDDLVERRTLADRLSDDGVTSIAALVGQQASREIPPGTVLTARMVTATPLVHRGQLISVWVESGRVHVKTVAEAREDGAFGQTIRVRKPGTTDEFNVVVTGAQAARALAHRGASVANVDNR